MVYAAACVEQAGFEIVGFKVGHLIEDLRRIQPGREEVEHVTHTNAHPAHTRAAATLLWIDGNSVCEVFHARSLAGNCRRGKSWLWVRVIHTAT